MEALSLPAAELSRARLRLRDWDEAGGGIEQDTTPEAVSRNCHHASHAARAPLCSLATMFVSCGSEELISATIGGDDSYVFILYLAFYQLDEYSASAISFIAASCWENPFSLSDRGSRLKTSSCRFVSLLFSSIGMFVRNSGRLKRATLLVS